MTAPARAASGQHLAAVDRDRLAGDPACGGRDEEERDLGHLLGRAQAPERDARQHARIERIAREPPPLQLPPGNSIEPGAMQFTRMPCFASATAWLCV